METIWERLFQCQLVEFWRIISDGKAYFMYSVCNFNFFFRLRGFQYLPFFHIGIFGCIWYIFWIIIVYAGPEQDKTISNDELLYIQKSLDATQNLESIKYPWKDILTSKAVHAIVAAHCAENWGFYTMLTQLPTFLAGIITFRFECLTFRQCLIDFYFIFRFAWF